MKRICLMILFGVAVHPAGEALAQDKPETIVGQVKSHRFKLDSTAIYQFEVKGKNFAPNVILSTGSMQNGADFFKERNIFRGLFMPAKTQEYSLIVIPNFGGFPDGPLDYTLEFKPMKFADMPLLKKDETLTAADPRYVKSFNKTAYKAYPINLKAGQTYIIDMMRKGEDSKIDPYLYLEDPKGEVIARDDDGGGFPNAHILIRPQADGEHRVIASGLSAGTDVGPFTILVRTIKSDN